MPVPFASIQMTSTHDIQENLHTAARLIEAAVAEGARLVVLPEMFALMGMGPQEKLKHREVFGKGLIQDFLQNLSMKYKVWIVAGTIPLALPKDETRARAACLVFNDQGLCVARYDKIHLFDANLRSSQEAYKESQTIEPGDEVVVVETPFGRLGLAVCYDLRFPELFRSMHDRGVEIIAVPTAFTYTTGIAHWDILLKARAIENMAYVIASCQTGVHPNGRKTYGHSMIVNPWGEVLASLAEDVGFISAKIDLDYLHELRADFPALAHRKL